MGALDDLLKQNNAPAPMQQGSALDNLLANQPAQQSGSALDNLLQQKPEEKGFISTALDYLDKPASAVAGAIEYATGNSQDANVLDAAVRGWQTNADYQNVIRNAGIDPESWQGQALNIGGKIALDPLWFLTPAKLVNSAKAGAKAIGVADDIADAGRAIKNSSIGQKAISAIDDIGNAEVGGLTLKRWVSSTSPLQKELDDLGLAQQTSDDIVREGVKKIDDLKKINPELGEYVTKAQEARVSTEQAANGISDLTKAQVYDEIAQKYSPEISGKVKETVDFINDINNTGSRGLLDRGIISQETFDKFNDRYIRREYSKYVSPDDHLRMLQETGQLKEAAVFEKGLNAIQRQASGKYKLPLDKIKQRQDLPEEVQQQLGRLMDATHPFAKGGKITSQLINRYDFLESVMKNHAKDAPEIGYRLIEGKKFGPLDGKYVPRDIYNEINRTVAQMTEPESWWRKGVAWWKMGKTVLNPATFMRNNISNVVLLNIAGMPIYDVLPSLVKAGDELYKPGKYTALAKKSSTFLSNSLTEQELRKFLDKSTKDGLVTKGINAVKDVTGKAADIYQGSEKLGKLAAFIWAMEKKGMNAEAAAKFADEALFNYSKVPPIVDSLRRSGLVPFATFPLKATEATAKALYERPAVVGKYYKPMRETQDPDEKKVMPDYLHPETLLPVGRGTRTVDGKPQKVSNYLDLRSILPFQSADQIGLSPALNIYSALKDNVDPQTGKPITRQGMTDDKKRATQADYLWKQLAPAFPLIPGTYGYDKLVNQGIKGEPDYKGRQYGLGEAVAQTIFGLRNVPVNNQEMAKQRISDLTKEIQSTQYEIRRVQQDRRLTEQQKKEQINEYKQKLIELSKEAQGVAKALNGLKKKEGS
jgi:hypothetical protein